MSQLNRSTPAFAGAAIAVSLLVLRLGSVDATEPTPTIIEVSTFESLGHAQPSSAREMAVHLSAALDAHPYVEARPEGKHSDVPPDFILKGSMYIDAEGARAFVALQLLDARANKRVWSENYDYRGIGADMMAADIRKYLEAHATDN